MTSRHRLTIGLGVAVAVGLLGPMLSAVATHTGNGHSAIRGTVTDVDGAPIAGICVTAYHDYIGQGLLPEGDPFLAVAGTTTTNEDGTYAVPRLTNDRYRVKFEQCLDPVYARSYLTEWYDDAPLPDRSDPVETKYGYDAYGIDAVLATL